MPLQALPTEILCRIFNATSQIPRWTGGEGRQSWYSREQHLKGLKQLRLTCKSFYDLCTDLLFEKATLYPEEDAFQARHSAPSSYNVRRSRNNRLDESDPHSSVSKFLQLSIHHELRHSVRKVVLKTSLTGEEASKGSDRVSEAWRDAASSIYKFPNLSSVQISFRELCCDDDNNNFNWVTEDEAFRADVLGTVFEALNNEVSPIDNLRSLTVVNLQNKANESITSSPGFKKVLSKISELHLMIAVEIEEASPESYTYLKALYEFHKNELPSTWLKPASHNLTHLTLHMNTYWGWLPSFDPRGIQFPNVRYLAMGNYTFAHDWQIDWITSHFTELETLIMIDCPILFHMYPHGCLGKHAKETSHEDHVKLANPNANSYVVSEHDDDSHWIYTTRWHHIFPKLEAKMLRLTKFVYAHEGWPHVYGMEQAFEERDQLISSFQLKRYVVFNGSIGPSQWEDDPNKSNGVYENFGDRVRVISPAVAEPTCKFLETDDHVHSPSKDPSFSRDHDDDGIQTGCGKQDKEAFFSLLRTVDRRAREMGLS